MIATGLAQLSHEQVERFRPKEMLAYAGVESAKLADLRRPLLLIAEAPNAARHLAALPRTSGAMRRMPWQTIEPPVDLDQTAKP